jgi:hypothetical protein
MSIGPVELLIVKFPGDRLSGEIAPALAELVGAGLIRVFDLLFASKGEDGAVTVREMVELDEDDYTAFDPLVADNPGFLTAGDVRQLTNKMNNNSSAGLLLFENIWATRLRDVIANAHGEVVLNERIPPGAIEELLAAHDAARV